MPFHLIRESKSGKLAQASSRRQWHPHCLRGSCGRRDALCENRCPQGDDLPRLLVAQLTRSGKAITPTQSTWFNAQADALASALEQEDEGAALEVLESVSRKVDPTQIGSFAESAVRMQSLAKTVVDGIRAELDLQQQRWSELDDQDRKGWLASARWFETSMPQ